MSEPPSVPFDPDPIIWLTDTFTADRGNSIVELQAWSDAFPLIPPGPTSKVLEPNAPPSPQTCTNCGKTWTCTKSPPEVHELCRKCNEEAKTSLPTSVSPTITPPLLLPPSVELIDSVIASQYALDRSFPALVKHAHDFVDQAHSHLACQTYAAEQVKAGHGVDKALVDHHLSLLRQHGLVKTCTLLQAHHAENYLQPDVVRDEYVGFPQFDLLSSLATEGAHILKPNNWKPNMGEDVHVRNICNTMSDAVNVRMAQEQALGDVLLVECSEFKAMAAAGKIAYHVTELGWVFKPGHKLSDLLGRIIDDYTNSPGPLNTPDTRISMEELYGILKLPQLADMCASLLQARNDFPNEPIYGAKEDVSRAYRRVKIFPADCPYMVVLMPPNKDGTQYYAIRLSQPFGHNASGHAWAVVSRAIEWRMNQLLRNHPLCPLHTIPKSLYGMYVDDLYSFGGYNFLQRVGSTFDEASRVAGKGARAIDKHDLTLELQSLGWTFIDRFDAVLPNPKGWFNLISLFFVTIPWNLSAKDKLPAQLLLRMGSYASRYSRALLPLRAFVHAFYGAAGDASVFAVRKVTARVVQDVWMWRIFLRLAHQRPILMATPVHWPVVANLSPQEQADRADRVVFVDAATSSYAIGIYIKDVAWTFFVCPVLKHFRKSAWSILHINILEMIAVVAGALTAIIACPSISHLHVWGDNTTSVAWAESNRVDCPISCFLTQMLTLLGASRRILITVGWVEGVRNPIADAISRNFNVKSGSQIQDQLNHPPYHHVPVSPAFISGITHASSMLQCETFAIAQSVRTVLAGISTSDSV